MTTKQATILLELEYRPDVPQVESSEGRPGHYIGSGTGTAVVDGMSGTVRWDLFEDQAPERCAASFVGVITFDNDEMVRFETTGWLHVPDRAEPHRWEATGHRVSFTTDGGKTGWLDGMTGHWVGTFDANTYRHRYAVQL